MPRLDSFHYRCSRAVTLWNTFGTLIGNSDRHLGNLSFLTEDYERFSLAPAYDMLPMRWAPSSQGEVIERSPDISTSSLDPPSFGRAADMAEDFWMRVRDMESLAGRMAEIAKLSLAELESARRKMALLAF